MDQFDSFEQWANCDCWQFFVAAAPQLLVIICPGTKSRRLWSTTLSCRGWTSSPLTRTAEKWPQMVLIRWLDGFSWIVGGNTHGLPFSLQLVRSNDYQFPFVDKRQRSGNLPKNTVDRERFSTEVHHVKYYKDNTGNFAMPAGMVPDVAESDWVLNKCTFNISDGYHRIMVRHYYSFFCV